MNTVLGLFADFWKAQRAVQELESAGFCSEDISLVIDHRDAEADRIAGDGWLAPLLAGRAERLCDALTEVGIPSEDAADYEARVREGGTLLALRVPEAQAERAALILEEQGAANEEERAEPDCRESADRSQGFAPSPLEVAAGESALPAFQEGSLTFADTVEEVIVTRQVVVVEEIVVRKEIVCRTVTIHNSVRHTEVVTERWEAG